MTSAKILSALNRIAVLLGAAALLTIAFGVVPSPAQPVAPTALTLRTHVTVSDRAVSLGDLFEGLADDPDRADAVVAYAPPPGRRAVFDAAWLGRVAERHQLDWRPAGRLDRVVVERASTVVDATDIATALRAEIAGRGDADNIELDLSNRNLLIHIDDALPPTIEVVQLTTDMRRGKFSAVVAVPAGDPQARRLTVTGQVHSMVEVPVPVRALRPGTVIRADDVAWKRVRANLVQNDTATEMADFVGHEARRPLAADAPARRSQLREPIAVAKGMLVTMTYSTPSMVLTASGRALEDGATGDFISVRNAQTNATVDARVLGPNRVEVAALRQLATSQGTAQ